MFPKLCSVNFKRAINVQLTLMQTWTNFKAHPFQFSYLFHGEVHFIRRASERPVSSSKQPFMSYTKYYTYFETLVPLIGTYKFIATNLKWLLKMNASSALSTQNVLLNIHMCIIRPVVEVFVPTNALRQFFHCLLYYKDAPIRISAVILPSSGGILSEFLHRPILWLCHNIESVFVTTSYKIL
jgi:hypothetical protein